MIKAVALDDEPPALAILAKFCSGIDYIDLVKTFSKTNETLHYLENFPVDLLFLDIQMPSISGLEFKKMIPDKTMVIFTTAFSEFAIDGFNLDVVDYLLKPFTNDRFQQAAEKAKVQYNFLYHNDLNKQDHIMIRSDHNLIKVLYTNILFIEGLDDYIKIHLHNQRPIVTRITMKALSEKLPRNEFIRVHKSYIVPLKKIESVRNKIISINGEEIPIGRSYEESFFSIFGNE